MLPAICENLLKEASKTFGKTAVKDRRDHEKKEYYEILNLFPKSKYNN